MNKKEYNHNYYLKNKEKHKAIMAKWRRENPERNLELRMKWKIKMKKLGKFNRGNRAKQSFRYQEKNKTKIKAYRKVRKALENGQLIKPIVCQICNNTKERIMTHHADYAKPLDVIWVCWKCHNEIHKIIKRERGGEINARNGAFSCSN